MRILLFRVKNLKRSYLRFFKNPGFSADLRSEGITVFAKNGPTRKSRKTVFVKENTS
jgi:hypothetical protein